MSVVKDLRRGSQETGNSFGDIISTKLGHSSVTSTGGISGWMAGWLGGE